MRPNVTHTPLGVTSFPRYIRTAFGGYEGITFSKHGNNTYTLSGGGRAAVSVEATNAVEAREKLIKVVRTTLRSEGVKLPYLRKYRDG